jgi:ABC-2 type transport system ATP-binding protein
VNVGGGDAALDARDVAMAYGETPVLDGLTLQVAPGQVVALLGRNGAGKSTFAAAVAGLRPPLRGSVEVCGYDVISERYQAQACLGFAMQETSVYPLDTVTENLRFFGRLAGLTGPALELRIEAVCAALGLDHLRARKGSQLSGGERRRLHTAISLVHRPSLLLLDEPTVGADVESRGLLLDLVQEIADDGAAVLYTTHYLTEVETLHAEVAVLHSGRIITSGTVDDIVKQFGHGVIELTFDGPVPPSLAALGRCHGPRTVAIETARPGPDLARLLQGLGSAADSLVDLRLVQPSLETAYLALVGVPAEPVGTERNDGERDR